MNKYKSRFGFVVFLLAAIFFPNATLAAPGKLSDSPLFLGSKVKSNILFVMDDSGSMENEILLSTDALNIWQYKKHPNSGAATSRNITPPYNNSAKMLQMCRGYNALAYNPDINYVPWNGVDYYGKAYVDQSISAARDFVFGKQHNDIWDNETTNLLRSDVGYTRWDDANKNGIFDAGECGERSISTNPSNSNIDKSHFVSTQSMSSAERVNFANWYSYYRKRRFVLNSSMIDILNSIDMRVGLATINNDGGVAQEVIDAGVPKNRETLLRKYQEIGRQKSTPLRRPLENAGRYYEGKSIDKNFVSSSTKPQSPILAYDEGGSCQKNFTMLLTDGYSNEGSVKPRGGIGNADGDNSSPYDGGDYADKYSNTLGDIAMHYYEKDLKPDDSLYPDIVARTNDRDTNPAQHMLTYAIAFGVKGALDDYPSPGQANWPNASSSADLWNKEKQASLDDLMHAAFNGRGKFLSALNPNALKQGLNSVIDTITSASQGTAASVGFNSTNISDNTLVYQSRFYSDYWTGTLQAFDFSGGGEAVCLENTSLSCPSVPGDTSTCPSSCQMANMIFDAAQVLDKRVANKGHKDREIITFNGIQGIPFSFPQKFDAPKSDELSALQIRDLIAEAPDNGAQAYGEDLLAYLRGDNTHANSIKFRNRNNHVLGDIAHSGPQIMGPPKADYPNYMEGPNNPYQSFVMANKDRDNLVFVGGNDGMLHGFDAQSGDEVFAYIPHLIFSDKDRDGLHFIADPGYTHKPYVDGTVTIKDVFVKGEWRTYVVGGLGAGGKGIYGLDITDPKKLTENNAKQIVKFEFEHKDLGYTFSRPQIVKLNNGKWAAVFGNGYANDDGDGRAKLFIFYLDGSGHKIIDTGVGRIVNGDCLDQSSDCNGLSSPTLIDINGDAVMDRVYAGDLHGNMWVFDFSSNKETDWQIAHRDNFDNAQPLFSACADNYCTKENRQPITSEPVVTGHDAATFANTNPNILVLFGTGQYLGYDDITNTDQQAFYAVWDTGSEGGGITRQKLAEQKVGMSGVYRSLSQNAVNYRPDGSGHYGWLIDLPIAGERIVIKPLLAGHLVLFVTTIPNGEPCSSGGSGFLMAADVTTGARPEFAVFDEIDQSAILMPDLPVGLAFIENKTVIPNSSGVIDSFDTVIAPKRPSRRVNWSIIK